MFPLGWSDPEAISGFHPIARLHTEAPDQLLDQLEQLLSAAIPEGESRKHYGVFLWGETQEDFSQAAAGGRLKQFLWGNKRQQFEEVLAALASSEHAVFLSKPLGSRVAGRRKPPHAVCGIACGIGSGSHSAGLLIVESDRYDLCETLECPILECLSQEAARALSVTRQAAARSDLPPSTRAAARL